MLVCGVSEGERGSEKKYEGSNPNPTTYFLFSGKYIYMYINKKVNYIPTQVFFCADLTPAPQCNHGAVCSKMVCK